MNQEVIPLQAVASQTVQVLLSGLGCRINVYQKFTGLFLDLYVNDQLLIGGVLCENKNPIIRDAYLAAEANFIGDLLFFDTEGDQAPDSTGLGGRYVLAYLTP